MSLHEYLASPRPPFYALIMQADTDNVMRLKSMWPEVWAELYARYQASGGILESDEDALGVER